MLGVKGLKKNRSMLKSWGNYPKCDIQTTTNLSESCIKTDPNMKEYVAYGNGRSYGDSALSKNVIDCRLYNYLISFDNKTGIVHCQAGVLLSDIIDTFMPRCWFLNVTPGTKFVTVAGAVASDVHGKNHHIDGCFSNDVIQITLQLPSGECVNLSHGDDLFHATCGGMGLTGIILEVKLKLKKIQSTNIIQKTIKTSSLQDTFEQFEKHKNGTYSVAWIDCMAKNKRLGRSLLTVGEFSTDGDFTMPSTINMDVKLFFPSFVLNKLAVKIFNILYYGKVFKRTSYQKISFDTFFYPLDAVLNWNRIYGKKGFVQYQVIFPKACSYEALSKVLSEISKEGGGSFLAVLKLYGKENKNYLSFPMEGYSLALDFKMKKGLLEFLDRLDRIVVEYGGRIYLAKDSRVSKEVFEQGYPDIDKFRQLRKKYKMDVNIQSYQSKRLGI